MENRSTLRRDGDDGADALGRLLAGDFRRLDGEIGYLVRRPRTPPRAAWQIVMRLTERAGATALSTALIT